MEIQMIHEALESEELCLPLSYDVSYTNEEEESMRSIFSDVTRSESCSEINVDEFVSGISPLGSTENSDHKFREEKLDAVSAESKNKRGTLIALTRCTKMAKLASEEHNFSRTEEKLFACDQCSYTCNQIGRLNSHILIHSGEKPFACDQCSYRCQRNRGLNLHKLTHSEGKPFGCDQCSFKCNQKTVLNSHKLLHKKEKVYSCNLCTYSCKQMSRLASHKLSHLNEKLFSCDLCKFICNKEVKLNVHKNIHNSGQRKE